VLQLSTTLVHISQAVAVAVGNLPATASRAAVLAVVVNLELLRWVPQAQMALKALTVLAQDQVAVLVEAVLPALFKEGRRADRADTYYPDQAVLVAILVVVGMVVLADQAITQAERVARVVLTQVALWILQAAVVAGEQVAEPTG
tara:strand:- start:82 stop:516 length:435 start_codon:yes stop_codon:yes gene_type:complete